MREAGTKINYKICLVEGQGASILLSVANYIDLVISNIGLGCNGTTISQCRVEMADKNTED